MADSHVISGLKAKEEELKKRISGLRKEVKACQEDLDSIRKALRIFGETWRAGGSRLFRLGEMNKIVLDDVDQLAAIVIEREGFDPIDQETVKTIRQRCTVAMYRHIDRGKVVKERRGSVRVWRPS